MSHEATETQKLGTRMASHLSSAAAAAGEGFDRAIGYTQERTNAIKDSVQHAVEDGWTGLRERAAGVPVTPLLMGIGAGFCIGWFVRSQISNRQ